ncbi:MAG: haloalkane dehalogenase, partial [Halioglobus sp.]|nr:haloalkane dehalogenase [Halioglobus sp.]
LYWRKFASESDEILKPGTVLDSIGGARKLAVGEKEAYDAPFPDETYSAGARQFPTLVPIFADEPEVAENRAALEVLTTFDKPYLCAFADDDPVTAAMEKPIRERVPGCSGMPHRTIGPAGHFLQQDQPEQCVQAILDVIAMY